MKTIDLLAGTHIRDACQQALAEAQLDNLPVQFEFNGDTFTVQPDATLADVHSQYEAKSGHTVLSSEEESRQAKERMAKMLADQADAIARAGAMTESEMRDSDPPRISSLEDLSKYIEALTKRPHDYGTCVYAMSLAAVAAFNFVAGALGVTGFQAGCADMDIIRRTRSLKHGFRLLDYGNLLYPQYCDAENFPHWDELLAPGSELLPRVAAEAAKCIAENPSAHPDVIAHWEMLVARSANVAAV